jgi:hypothetical protein
MVRLLLLSFVTVLLATTVPATVDAQNAPARAQPNGTAAPRPAGKAPLHAAEAIEGLWVKTKEDCDDDESPNSRTTIDFAHTENGKPAPIIDRYENHCLIKERISSSKDTILSVVCYEFWDDLTRRINGSEARIKLAWGQKGRLLIDGTSYQRCNAPLKTNARSG